MTFHGFWVPVGRLQWQGVWKLLCPISEQNYEAVHGQAGLVDDTEESLAFKVPGVKRKRDPCGRILGMFKNVVASGNVVHVEARPC